MTKRPTLILADDHALMTEGLRAMLEPDHEVLDVVRDGSTVVSAVSFHRPDLILLDISLPGRSGIEIATEIHERFPDTRILMVTMHAERIYADEALRSGASGYVLKLARAEELRHAIQEVLAGREYVTPLLTDPAAAARTAPAGIEALTERQREVLRLLARGRTSHEIAEMLSVSPKAVEFHRVRIKKALGLNSTAALVRYAVAEGLV
ncbi:MAG TPA: response regulator transcription factor [Gemmatimonadales bacterium]